MSAIQRKQTKKQETSEPAVQESIEIPLPQPKEKGSSKQETAPAHVVVDIVDDDFTPSETKPSKKEKGSSKQKEKDIVDDDSTPSVTVAETKPPKKGKKTAPKSDEDEEVKPEVEPAPKKGKGKKQEEKVESGDEGEGEGEVVEKSKKHPPKSLGEQITDSVEILASQSERLKGLIESKEALQKHLTSLISSRKKELKKQKEDESEDANLQFLEKQKDSLKDEITTLKSSIRELASVSKVIEKATKQLDSKKKKSGDDSSKPKKERAKNIVPVSTDSMNQFIQNNLTLTTNDGKRIFEQTPETNSDGRFLVERTQLMQLIHAYIREKSLRKDGSVELDSQLKPLFHAYLEGDFSRKVDSKSVICILSNHLEKKA